MSTYVLLLTICPLLAAFSVSSNRRTISSSDIFYPINNFPAVSKLFMAMHPSEMIDDGDNDEALSFPSEVSIPKDEIQKEQSSALQYSLPTPDLCPSDIPRLLMRALEKNNLPAPNDGLTMLWNFSGEGIHGLYNGSLEKFLYQCQIMSDAAPSSFYGMALNGLDCSFVYHPLNHIGGSPGGSWIATQIMTGTNAQGLTRNFQWRLIKQRRPPNLNCWFVEGLTVSDPEGNFRIEESV